MNLNLSQLKHDYDELGYFVLRDFFSPDEMAKLRSTILAFHEKWKADNHEFYQEVAFNSSLITGSQYLADSQRLQLFNFIASDKLMAVVNAVIPNFPAFMNTQLFFNPPNPELKDFWHRDCQYDHDVDMQKIVIHETQVVHFRVPLFDELGVELIPGTHKRWDTEEEFAVREELNGRHSNESLPNAERIPLKAGDLLVFSADMLHRGLYGLERLAWDILMFDSAGDFVDYVDDDCLPETHLLKSIDNPDIYHNILKLKAKQQQLQSDL
ncbi:phytanoyl-CoA dioxygenase family protein [Catenovulum sp. SM1970]|uniref:phytanoyl-CoA dioxygenase family protein n=1 Tax=Marinifaba aquimaris TaxID=2741323 RepID=UPI001571D232|nr:phytanoyl-CoA dioxygenase family protein [Marinifaba aquimaris]NTS78031.1 phytanoyl-CoA dioxygenase family protein [Marinifaba aquimaris]